MDTATDIAAAIRYPDIPIPAEGEIVTVCPGILWARFPLPFRLDHVNIWILEDEGDAVTVIDAGLGDDATRARWETLLEGPLADKRITRVVATHFHPDHMGLCGWLVKRTGAKFTAGLADWLLARLLSKTPSDDGLAASRAFYHRAGADEGLIEHILGHGGSYKSLVGTMPPTLDRLRVGEHLTIGGREWVMVPGSGHSPEPVSLHCAELNMLISGDQVLPRISPNISIWPEEPDGDPLADFIGSFDDLETLPANILVLPSHDQPFTGLHDRLGYLRAHHAERLDEIAGLCIEPRSALEIAESAFTGKKLDAHQRMFALGEVLAHLNHMMRLGRVTRMEAPDGVDRYRATT